MKNHWRKLAALLPLTFEKKVYRDHFAALHKKWEREGAPVPPSHLMKQKTVRKYAEKGGHTVLVETGTYLGDMVYAMQDVFEHIYSIELAEIFFQKAAKRFKNFPHIKILRGDSGKVLQQLVPSLKAPALFWLDGHYSGGQTAKGEKESPIYEELKSILHSSYRHTILIDDARLFIGQNDYPRVDELKKFILELRPQSNFFLENDAIVILLS